MNQITTVGVDLAKEVIVACTGDAQGRVLACKALSFGGFADWLVKLPPCTVGFEACSSAHYWARFAREHGHDAKLMAAEQVTRFRRNRLAKNDRNDAEAVLAAVQHPEMQFVSVKSLEQQALLAWHRVRIGYTQDRTALINRVRGLLAEFGVWLARSASTLVRSLPELAEDERLPPLFRPVLLSSLEQLKAIEARIAECDERIRDHVRHNEQARRVQALTGVGHLTASALLATIANARDFRNGRQLAAWAGLVPRQYSSGGKQRLGAITRRGDCYLRGLLTQGARSTLQVALKCEPLRRSRLQQWIVALHDRIGYHKTLVAIANKHARILWAILAHGEDYDPNAWQRHHPPRRAA